MSIGVKLFDNKAFLIISHLAMVASAGLASLEVGLELYIETPIRVL